MARSEPKTDMRCPEMIILEQDPNFLNTMDSVYEGRRKSEHLTRDNEKRSSSAEPRRCSEPASLRIPPQHPPAPSLSHLTKEEVQILNGVFAKMENFEHQESSRIRALRRDVAEFEEHVRRQSTVVKSRFKHVDLRLCRLCFKTKFADGIGRVCNDCRRRVCQRCGSFTKTRWDPKKNKLLKGRWRCTLCQMRWELAAASGVWFNNGQGHPALSPDLFRQKISDMCLTSDWNFCLLVYQGSADVELSDSSTQRALDASRSRSSLRGHLSRQSSRTDSEAPRSSTGGKQSNRRRVSSAGDSVVEVLEDEEEFEVDDELFLLERQKCRQERLLMQNKKTRRRVPRTSSIGTSTMEDSLTDQDTGGCPRHGHRRPSYTDHDVPRQQQQRRQESNKPSRPGTSAEKSNHKALTQSERRGNFAKVKTDPLHRKKMHSHKNEESPSSGRRSSKHLSDTDMPVEQSGVAPEGSHTLGVPSKGSPHIRRRSAELCRLQKPVSADRRVSDPGAAAVARKSAAAAAAGAESGECVTSVHRLPPITLDSLQHGASAADSSNLRLSADGSLEAATAVPIYLKDYDPAYPGSVQIVPLIITNQSSLDSSYDGDIVADIQRRLSSCSKRTSDGSISIGNSKILSEAASPLKRQKMLTRSSSSNSTRVILKRDPSDQSCRTGGLGMRVVGGKQCPDGRLGAFVTHLIDGAAADLAGISIGDQVLEWDGSSLEDATYEECQQVMSRSGDTVQLLVNTRSGRDKKEATKSSPPSTREKDKEKTDEKDDEKTKKATEQRMERAKERAMRVKNWLSDSKDTEDKAETHWGDGREINGRLQLRIWFDARACVLSVTVLIAQNLAARPGPEKEKPHSYTKLYLNQDKSMSEVMKTSIVQNSQEPEWNMTYTLHGIGPEKVRSTSILAVVWDYYAKKDDVFVGEVLLDLATTDLQDNSLWYPLEPHDENCGRLPKPERKWTEGNRVEAPCGDEKRPSYGSLPLLPKTPAHDKAKQLLGKRATTGRRSLTHSAPSLVKLVPKRAPTTLESVPSEDPTTPPSEDKYKGRIGKLRHMKRRMSEVAIKVGAILQDRRDLSSPGGVCRDLKTSREQERRHSVAELGSVDDTVSMSRKGRLFRRQGSQSSGMTLNSSTNSEDETDNYFASCLRPSPEGHDVTTLLGPAQAAPQSNKDHHIQGDIKLGFMISKGQLEIEVMCARSLAPTSAGTPPDTYVKTCLVGNGKRLQKKKTNIVRQTCDPCYMQKLKYSACNVHGRCMQIQIKEKASGFDRNRCLGEVLVKLDDLDLSTNTVGWYKLFVESAAVWGSCDSIAL